MPGKAPLKEGQRTTHAGQITAEGFYFDGLSQGSAKVSFTTAQKSLYLEQIVFENSSHIQIYIRRAATFIYK